MINLVTIFCLELHQFCLEETYRAVGKTGNQDHPEVTHESIHKKLQAHWHYGHHAPEYIENSSGVRGTELPYIC